MSRTLLEAGLTECFIAVVETVKQHMSVYSVCICLRDLAKETLLSVSFKAGFCCDVAKQSKLSLTITSVWPCRCTYISQCAQQTV